MSERVERFVEAAEQRYLKDLTWQEARRALQALSTIYTQKRDKLAEGAALDRWAQELESATAPEPRDKIGRA